MGRRTDVFVIGGGPAGLAAAIAARRKGFHVVVADGARPPIEKACGEGLMPSTLAALGDLGMSLQPNDGFAFRGIRFLEGGLAVDANFPSGQGMGVRRPILHQRMVEEALARGVKLMWGAPVTGIERDGVRLAGRVIPARWIIGADGSGSRVRRWSGLDAHTQNDTRYACRRHYRVQPWTDRVEIYWGQEMQAYVTPTAREEVCVVLMSRKRLVRFDAAWREFPDLAARLESAEMASRERGAFTAMHRLERVYRGRVALIGDASGGVDAITGDGLRLGFYQAAALAEAMEAGDLSSYQAAHRRLARQPALMGRLMLLLGRHARLRHRAMRALAANPELFARLMAIHVGETSPAHLAATGALLGWRLLLAE
jgi:flavin-dependent dehydrogenase